jgi:tetratricopeptide (TPR) repeat protein
VPPGGGAAANPAPAAAQIEAENAQLEAVLRTQPNNVPALMKLIQNYLQGQQAQKALVALDQAVANPQADANILLFAIQKYNELSQIPQVEQTLQKLVKVLPDSPEVWFDLAGVQMSLNQAAQAVASLKQPLQLNAKRLQTNPKASNLFANVQNDARFAPLRNMPEFQQILAENVPPTP